MERWFFSTNAKDINTLYLIFALFLGMIASTYTFITIFFLACFFLINQFKIINKLSSLGPQFLFSTSILFYFAIFSLGGIFIMDIVQDFKFLQSLSEMFNFYYFNVGINLFYFSLNSLPFIQEPISEFYMCFIPGVLLQKEITSETSLCSSEDLPNQLNPNFVTGFCDAESSFIVSIRDSPTKIGWKIEVKFQIGLHSKDTEILYKIQ
jgi:LAGLIDADG endonuclease